MARDSFTFYANWRDMYNSLPRKYRPIFIEWIMRYELDGEPPQLPDGISSEYQQVLVGYLSSIQPIIDKALKKSMNGLSGGVSIDNKARYGNKNASKTQAKRKVDIDIDIDIDKDKGLLLKEEKEEKTEVENETELPVLQGEQRAAEQQNTSAEMMYIDDAVSVLAKQQIFIENCALMCKITPVLLCQKLCVFAVNCKAKGLLTRSLSETQKHFVNWLRKESQNQPLVDKGDYRMFNDLIS